MQILAESNAGEIMTGIAIILGVLFFFGGDQISDFIAALKVKWGKKNQRPTDPNIKFCTECGAKYPLSAKHCGKCGSKL